MTNEEIASAVNALAPVEAPLSLLQDKKQNKLTALQNKKAVILGTKDTLTSMEDADSLTTDLLGTFRETTGDGSYYDAVELQHGNRPIDMFGATKETREKYQKSEASMAAQREQVGRLLGKDAAAVTQQDFIDVGNQQQIQKLADLARTEGEDRWEAPLIRGVEQTNLTGRYKDESGNGINVPLNVPITSKRLGETSTGRVLGSVGDIEGRDVTAATTADPALNARFGHGTVQVAPAKSVDEILGTGTGYWENAARSIAATVGSTAADVVDGFADAGANLGQKAAEAISGEKVTAEDIPNLEKLGFQVDGDGQVRHYWGYEKDGVTSNQAYKKLLGADDTEHQKVVKNFSNTMDKVWESEDNVAVKVAKTVKGVYDHIEAVPQLVGDSMTYVYALYKQPLAMLAGATNQHLDERLKVTGEAADMQTTLAVAGGTAVELAADYIAGKLSFGVGKGLGSVNKKVIDTMFKGLPKSIGNSVIAKTITAITKKATGLAAGAAEEFSTEAFQEAMGMLVERVGIEKFDGKEVWGLLDAESQKAIKEAGWSGLLAGGGQSAAGTAVNAVSKPTGKLLKDKLQAELIRRQNKKDAIITPNEAKEVDTIKSNAEEVIKTKGKEAVRDRVEIAQVKASGNAAALKEYRNTAVDTLLGGDKAEILGSDIEEVEKLKRVKELVSVVSEDGFIDEKTRADILTALEGKFTATDRTAIETAINEGQEQAAAEGVLREAKSMSIVSKEVSTGPRGFLTYFNAAKAAIAGGDMKTAEEMALKLDSFGTSQNAKVQAIKAGEEIAIKAIGDKVKLTMKERQIGATEAAKIVMKEWKDKQERVGYGSQGQVWDWQYSTIMEKMAKGKNFNRGGGYLAYDAMIKELEAMSKLYSDISKDIYPEAEVTPVKTVKEDTNVEKEEVESAAETPKAVEQEVEAPVITDADIEATEQEYEPVVTEVVEVTAQEEATIADKNEPAVGGPAKEVAVKDLSNLTQKQQEFVAKYAAGEIKLTASKTKRYNELIEKAKQPKKVKPATESVSKQQRMKEAAEVKIGQSEDEAKAEVIAIMNETAFDAQFRDMSEEDIAEMARLEEEAAITDEDIEITEQPTEEVVMADEEIEVTPQIDEEVVFDEVPIDVVAQGIEDVETTFIADEEVVVQGSKTTKPATAPINTAKVKKLYESRDALVKREEELTTELQSEEDADKQLDLELELNKVSENLEKVNEDIDTEKNYMRSVVEGRRSKSGRAGQAAVFSGLGQGNINISKDLMTVSKVTGLNIEKITNNPDAKKNIEVLTKWLAEYDAKSPGRDSAGSPGRILLYDNEGNMDENVVIAMDAAMTSYIVDEFSSLTKPLEYDDIETMFPGIQITEELLLFLEGGAGLKKFEAEKIGAKVLDYLGLKPTSTTDDKHYQALKADLGMMAMLIGQEKGLVEVEGAGTKLTSDLYKTNTAGKASVPLVRAADGVTDKISQLRDDAKALEEAYGIETTSRRTYTTVKPEGSRPVDVHNQPYTTVTKEQADTINVQESMGYKVNKGIDVIKEVFIKDDGEVDVAKLREAIGYVDVKTIPDGTVSFDEKKAIEVRNAAIELAVDDLLAMPTDKEVFFKWFVTKGGRFNMDSITVNPQIEKRLHRWLVTAEAANTDVDVAAINALLNDEKPTDDKVIGMAYAIAQAFDFDIDKNDEEAIINKARELMAMNRDELKQLLVDGKVDHVGHAAAAIAAIDAFKDARESGSKKFTTNLTLEVDGLTNGYAFRIMQFPIGDYKKWLPKVGVVPEGSKWYSKESINAVKASGEEADTYETLAEGFNERVDNTIGAMSAEKRANTTKVHEAVAAAGMVPVVTDVVSREIRNLMKTPTMAFNYSAGFASIKRAVARELTDKAIARMLEKDKDGYIVTDDELRAIFGQDINPGKIRAGLINKPMSHATNKTVYVGLMNYFQDVYGEAITGALNDNFGQYIALNNVINQSFDAMYQVMKELYDRKIKALGFPVTQAMKIQVVKDLLPYGPAVAGPDSKKQEEYILVLGRALETPDGVKVDTKLNEEEVGKKTATTQLVVRGLASPGSAGAVIPIHTMDGAAILGSVIKHKTLGVHDAQVIGVGQLGAIKKYNKDWYELNKRYSIIDAIGDSFAETVKKAKAEGIDVSVKMGKKTVGLNKVEEALNGQIRVVKAGREELFAMNLKIGQMVGPNGTMYEVNGTKATTSAEAEEEAVIKPVKKTAPKKTEKLIWNKNADTITTVKGGTVVEASSLVELIDISNQYHELMAGNRETNREYKQHVAWFNEIFKTLENSDIAFRPVKLNFVKSIDKGTTLGQQSGTGIKLATGVISDAYPLKVVLHEYAHVITAEGLDSSPALMARTKLIMDKVLAHSPELATEYGFTNEKEFLAEAISSPRFQTAIKKIPAMGDRLVDQVKKIFAALLKRVGAKGASALDDALQVVLDLQVVVERNNVPSTANFKANSAILTTTDEKNGAKLLMSLTGSDTVADTHDGYVEMFKNVVEVVTKPLVVEDSNLLLKMIAQGIDGYIAGQYDPSAHEIKITTKPSAKQVDAAVTAYIDAQYFEAIEGLGVTDENLHMYMQNDELYRRMRGELKAKVDEVTRTIDEILANSSTHAVAHEYVHAGAANYMRNNPNSVAVKRIRELYKKALNPRYAYVFAQEMQGLNDTDANYWKKSEDEFLAEALSNPRMMRALNRIEVKAKGGKLVTVLHELYRTMLGALGIKESDSLYSYVLDGYLALMEEQAKVTEGVLVDPRFQKISGPVLNNLIQNTKDC